MSGVAESGLCVKNGFVWHDVKRHFSVLVATFVMLVSLAFFSGLFPEVFWLPLFQMALLMMLPMVLFQDRSGSFLGWGVVVGNLAVSIIGVFLIFLKGWVFLWSAIIYLLVNLVLAAVMMGWMRKVETVVWGGAYLE